MAIEFLQELRNPGSSEALVKSLKALKNEIVGHSHRKELWVRRGIVIALHKILETYKTSSKQRQGDNVSDSRTEQHSWMHNEEARLQAIAIVGSLAHGGPAFMLPLRAGKIIVQLLDIVSPTESSPDLVLAALRSLNAIADAVSLENTEERVEEEEDFLDVLYTDRALSNLNQILKDNSPSLKSQQQINLAIQLIAKTSNTERRRKQITISKIFDSLALKLASFVISSRPQTSFMANDSGVLPAHPAASLPLLLHAICTIIADSKIRASEFCCYAVWRNIFPYNSRDIYAWRVPAVGTAATSSQSGLGVLASQQTTRKSKNTHNLPPFNSLVTVSKLVNSHLTGTGESGVYEGFNSREHDDTPLVKWLLGIVRTRDGLTRLMAIWFIGILFRSHMVSVKRQNTFSMLLIPTLVKMLDSDASLDEEAAEKTSPLEKTTSQFRKEIAPRVLAFFVQDNEFLQKSAMERNAIKKLSQLLKQAFNPISASLLTPMWNARDAEESTLSMDPSKPCVLGRPGIEPIVHHTHQVRESYLIALSAMTTLTNDNKQAIIDNGVVSFVIESLNPGSHDHGFSKAVDAFKPGSSVATIIAACGTVRTLSRSVAILRTSLVDAGLAKPIYSLLSHPNMEVRIAATAAVANILLPFSAMRQDFTDAGALHTLCEHAHSSNSKLRISALLALSNFVVEAPNNLKIKVVQELSPEWLKRIICSGAGDGTESRKLYKGMGFATTAVNSPDTDDIIFKGMVDSVHDYLQDSQAEDINMSDFNSSLDQPEEHKGKVMPNAKYGVSSDEYFDALTDERTAAIQAARDDLSAQEQGLTLVRNLLVSGPDIGEIVEYLFGELGQDKLFDIFTDLLRPKSMNGFRGHDPRLGPSKLVPPPTEIVINVCYILVHIAASRPEHKQIVLAQKELLQLIKPLFIHPHPHVRVALVWLVINISWKEDAADRDAVVRALELKKLGIVDKVHEALSDSELDVRERAKQAIAILTDLIKC